jgi:hypothetical protein
MCIRELMDTTSDLAVCFNADRLSLWMDPDVQSGLTRLAVFDRSLEARGWQRFGGQENLKGAK